MYKTTRGVTKEMYFTDDGFPVGIAYCLAILKQVSTYSWSGLFGGAVVKSYVELGVSFVACWCRCSRGILP